MSGRNFLRMLWRAKWLAATILLVFLAVSAGVTALLPKTYQTTATVRVIPSANQGPTDAFSQVQTSQALARTYAELLKSPNIYREAAERNENLNVSPERLMGATVVSYVEGTELVQVQVESDDPRQASLWANAVAQTFVDGQEGRGNEELVLADPASVPTDPVSPSLPLNLALALLLGSVFAAGGIVLFEVVGDRVSSEEEIVELVEAPVLGILPRVDLAEKRGTGKVSSIGAYEEAVRSLRVNLSFALGGSSGRGMILVTSALPGEGKTTVSSHLAEAYALAKRKSLLIDADLRRPRIHAHFSLRNLKGFSNVLLDGIEGLQESVSEVKEVPGLSVLTSGPIPPNPVDLLSLDRTRELVGFLKERFDVVLADSPPAQALADASVLGGMADGVVLVVDASKARRRSLSRTVDQLRTGRSRILGVVMNNAPEKRTEPYYAYKRDDE